MDKEKNLNIASEREHLEINHVAYQKVLKEALPQLPKGAFLSVKKEDTVNVMTIGWGTFGVMWGKPVFVIGVRPSRYTYQFLDLGASFTVSVPLNQKLKKQLGLIGSKSGKNTDKIAQSQLTLRQGTSVNVPVIEECELHFECTVLAKHQLIPEYVDATIRERHYPDGDFHMIFYGEILDCYRLKP